MAPIINKSILPEEETGRKNFLVFLSKQVKDHPVVKKHHGKWKELIDWTDEGNQYSEWDKQASVMRPVTLKRRKRRVVINLMKPVAEALESKINTSYRV